MSPSALELPIVEPAATSAAVKFHLSLNVTELERSISFFRALFGREPDKCRADYAKFELDEPPVVLSLEPGRFSPGGALNHLGFRLADSATLVDWQRRLEMAGISTQREEGVECCYARQTKFWVRDPDNNLWEIYVLEEDLEHRGGGQAPHGTSSQMPSTQSGEPAQSLWQHQLGTPLPDKIFALDGSIDEVFLRGSFNLPHSAEQRTGLFAEIVRVLKPEGTLRLHMLTGQRAIDLERGTLPGPAGYVTHVPSRELLLADLAAAGFESVELSNPAAAPCFTHDGVAMWETLCTARKPV